MVVDVVFFQVAIAIAIAAFIAGALLSEIAQELFFKPRHG
jgi:hypothetical protein